MTTRFNLGSGATTPADEPSQDEVIRTSYRTRAAVASQSQLTGDIVNEAIESVFKEREVDSSTAEVLRGLMASDPSSGIAQAYYHSKAAAGLARSHLALDKKRLVVPYSLTDKQMAELTSYAPEYAIEFRGATLHDHPMAAASRMIDQVLVESKVPPGAKFSDVGGSPEHHAKRATTGVHICQPVVDPKDPARSVQRQARLRTLAATSSEKAVREFAQAYLSRDVRVVCDRPAQECVVQTPVVLSVHVYDIPMQDWPAIMESKGARLVEGCVLFSPKVMQYTAGEFEVAGAVFQVDPKRDMFRMGFKGSPSWWYQHSWLNYCKYGVDQILYGSKGAYSYKITERRGDTVFFRIIPVSRGVPRNVHQVYKLPEVEMVEVHGYDIGPAASTSSQVLRRKVWVWPMPLWRDMLRHALEMVERGTLNHERLYNYYRTIAPRQTINATLVAGGYTVSIQELVPLIVHVGVAAAAAVLGAQSVSKHIIGAEVAARGSKSEYTIYKVLAAFGSGMRAAFGLLVSPIVWLGDTITKVSVGMLQTGLVDWAPRAVCVPVNAKFLVMDVGGFEASHFTTDDVDFSQEVSADAPFDHVRAAMNDADLARVVLDMFSGALPGHVLTDLRGVVEREGKSDDDKSEVTEIRASSLDGESTTCVPTETSLPTEKARRDAVVEAIHECELEQKKVQASCAAAFSELCHVKPAVATMRRRLEEFRNPDFWWVECGVFTKSVLGVLAEDFLHSAVFIPVRNPDADSLVRPVYTQEYEGESQGNPVSRVHFVLADTGYTGWAFTNDSLLVYNGPEIVDAMKLSLDRDFGFSVKLVQGPPGCGKTTSIVNSYHKQGAVLCPVRRSMLETKGRLQDKHGARFVDWSVRVRTLDSYLVNYAVNKKLKAMTPEELLADEAFMSHSGKWYAAAALMGVERILAFGDRYQIPHVPRAETPSMHLRIRPDDVEYQWLTYRCPPDAVAAWGHVYEWKVRSTSQVGRSLSHVPSHRGLKVPEGCVMMGMYQADKKELRQMYAGCGVKIQIMTVHESEGNTYDCVWLHRFDRRKRSDNFSLYDKEPYVLVAMSRHRKEFVYVCPELDDLPSRWIKQAKDARRVMAASKVETAGVSSQFG